MQQWIEDDSEYEEEVVEEISETEQCFEEATKNFKKLVRTLILTTTFTFYKRSHCYPLLHCQ